MRKYDLAIFEFRFLIIKDNFAPQNSIKNQKLLNQK